MKESIILDHKNVKYRNSTTSTMNYFVQLKKDTIDNGDNDDDDDDDDIKINRLYCTPYYYTPHTCTVHDTTIDST